MRKSILLVCAAVFILGCDKDAAHKAAPACIGAKIDEILKEEVGNPPAKIYRYKYNGQTVYYLPPGCCDFLGLLYDEECNLLCAPDGGITGMGDGKCPDFFDRRTDEKLIWEDPRG